MSLNDTAWLERNYNNRALVPDFAEHLARWDLEGQRARRELSCVLDLPYGIPDGQTLDVFPAERAGAPVAVFIHGGYWRSLTKTDHSFVAPALHAMGATVVVPDYALCPAVTIPQITLQMVQALAWTWRNARRFNGDPSRITVIGHSAGGHLAAMLLACQWQVVDAALPPQVLRNALGISGLYDLDPIARTPFLQVDLRLTPGDVQRASPAHLPAPAQGQLYSVAGGDESAEFLRHNRLIQQAWGKKAVPLSEALPGLNHFSIMQALTQPGTRMHGLAAQVLAEAH